VLPESGIGSSAKKLSVSLLTPHTSHLKPPASAKASAGKARLTPFNLSFLITGQAI